MLLQLPRVSFASVTIGQCFELSVEGSGPAAEGSRGAKGLG